MFSSVSARAALQPISGGQPYTGSSKQQAGVKAAGKYPLRLNFYERAPNEEVTIEQFETWAIDRLKVLAEIESCLVRNRSHDELRVVLAPRIKAFLPLSSNTARNADTQAERMKDYISHFVLRLAFCRSEELRAKFIKTESILFRLRWEDDDKVEQQFFLDTLNLHWQPVSDSEKAVHRDKLAASSPGIKVDSESYFKVPWIKVADLVNSRRVFLSGGQAYVPARDQFSLILAEFQSRLNKALELTSRALPRLDEDDRLLPVLEHLSMGFLAGVTSQYTSTANQDENLEKVTAEMVDQLAKKHFPLCMRNLHETLRDKKHLRHYARLQYNLFLKGIGMPVEEALVFWRKGFSSMSDDKFNKEHKYNIRHGFGLEGKRMNYPPKNCQRIITQDQPGPHDSHGCPFRHFDESALLNSLSFNYGINGGPKDAQVKEILDAVKGSHFHVACTRVYEITHKDQGVKKGDGIGSGESVSHPNLYYERSLLLSKAPKEEMEVDVKP